MADRFRVILQGFQRLSPVRKIGILLMSFAILVFVIGLYKQYGDLSTSELLGKLISDFYANVSTELASIALTVLVIDYLNERLAIKREKEALIIQMGSPDNAFAVEAVRIMRTRGWLTDGSLVGRHFFGANLKGALLFDADLRRVTFNQANLETAHFERADLRGALLPMTNLKMSVLMDAKLHGAILTGACLKGAYIHGAQFDASTTLPNGKKWTPETDVTRFVNPEHPEYWDPEIPSCAKDLEIRMKVEEIGSHIQTAKFAGGKIMIELKGEIIVGVLGQWASGKTVAARTLIRYLGGEGEVVFINDRELLASQAVNHILELEDSKVTFSIEDDGRQRLDGEHATVWLGPGEDLKTVDLNTVQFDTHDDVVLWGWINRARVELGYQICERSADGKPIVIEAAFGTNMEPIGENPFSHTISDLFLRLEEAGVEPKQVKWIIVEAGYDKRSERNQKRRDSVPVDVFDRYAADGGDLYPDHQNRLEEQGTIIKRVPNDHDDIKRFRADIIAAFEEMFRGVLPARTVDGKREQK